MNRPRRYADGFGEPSAHFGMRKSCQKNKKLERSTTDFKMQKPVKSVAFAANLWISGIFMRPRVHPGHRSSRIAQ